MRNMPSRAADGNNNKNVNETWINALYINYGLNTMRFQHVTGNNVS